MGMAQKVCKYVQWIKLAMAVVRRRSLLYEYSNFVQFLDQRWNKKAVMGMITVNVQDKYLMAQSFKGVNKPAQGCIDHLNSKLYRTISPSMWSRTYTSETSLINISLMKSGTELIFQFWRPDVPWIAING